MMVFGVLKCSVTLVSSLSNEIVLWNKQAALRRRGLDDQKEGRFSFSYLGDGF